MVINDLRKKTTDERLSKKAKSLIKEWKNLFENKGAVKAKKSSDGDSANKQVKAEASTKHSDPPSAPTDSSSSISKHAYSSYKSPQAGNEVIVIHFKMIQMENGF